MANGKTEFIGIITPDLYHHFYSEMLNRILSTYETFHYKYLVFIGDKSEEIERQYIQELLAYKIEGMIILSHTIPSEEHSTLPIPIVTIEREDKFVCSVNTDNYMGGYQAAGLLARHRCDILIHVNSPSSELIPAHGRLLGFSDFCREHDIDHQIILKEFGHTHDSAKPMLEAILGKLERDYEGQKKASSCPMIPMPTSF